MRMLSSQGEDIQFAPVLARFQSEATGTVYFDLGSGYSENCCANFRLERFFRIRFPVSSEVVRIRLDPVEGYSCILRRLKVVSNCGNLVPVYTNGLYLGDSIVFGTSDPQLEFVPHAATKWLELSGEVIAFDQKTGLPLIEGVSIELAELIRDLARSQYGHAKTVNSLSYKLTRPFRAISDSLRQLPSIQRSSKVFKLMASSDPAYFLRRIRNKFSPNTETSISVTSVENLLRVPKTEKKRNDSMTAYSAWINRYDKLTDKTIAKVVSDIAGWKDKPLLSILMPVYNAPLDLLRAAIGSVQAQFYPNWELCIADDASSRKDVRDYLQTLQLNPRIKVAFRKENGNICAASNSALELCSGVFTVLMDQDDTLSPLALYEVVRCLQRQPDVNLIYSDEDKIDDKGERYQPFFKGNWDPYRILCQNYVNHMVAYRTELLKEIGGFKIGMEGSQDHDLVLRCAIRSSEGQIIHIPKVLYQWRKSSDKKSFSDLFLKKCQQSRISSVREYLNAKGIEASVSPGDYDFNKITFSLPNPLPIVSCIIPAKNHADLTRKCLEGVLKSGYQNLEIILVDNGSTEQEALDLCSQYERVPNVKVIHWDKPFNYSEINNMAANRSTGEYLLLLNNDVEPISSDWLKTMLGYASQKDVGCVGAKLLYPNRTIQHAGVVLLGNGVAGHLHVHENQDSQGYFDDINLPRTVSAVTGACLMIRKELFFHVGGFNEKDLHVAFNDVDLCLKVMESGYRNVFVPYALLYHHESISRGRDDVDPIKIKRFEREQIYMRKRWAKVLNNDPYYNPNLTRRSLHSEVVFPDEEINIENLF